MCHMPCHATRPSNSEAQVVLPQTETDRLTHVVKGNEGNNEVHTCTRSFFFRVSPVCHTIAFAVALCRVHFRFVLRVLNPKLTLHGSDDDNAQLESRDRKSVV